jgi:hypothetical protein
MNLIKLLEIFLTALSWVTLASAGNPIRATDGSDLFIVYTGGYYYLLTTS